MNLFNFRCCCYCCYCSVSRKFDCVFSSVFVGINLKWKKLTGREIYFSYIRVFAFLLYSFSCSQSSIVRIEFEPLFSCCQNHKGQCSAIYPTSNSNGEKRQHFLLKNFTFRTRIRSARIGAKKVKLQKACKYMTWQHIKISKNNHNLLFVRLFCWAAMCFSYHGETI